jgi:RNA methyltransferase, TrmH family
MRNKNPYFDGIFASYILDMPPIKSITSLANPLIKEIVHLSDKAKARKESGTFVVEGLREIGLAIKGGYTVKTIVFCPGITTYQKILDHLGTVIFDLEMIEVTTQVYNKIAYRESTEGIIAMVKAKDHDLNHLSFATDSPLILVAEAPEKPGNIGAFLRTCDAAGVDAVIIANPTADLYNPNIIRSSVGGLFTVQIAMGSTAEIIQYLILKGIKLYCATIADDSVSCYSQDFTMPCAIIVGTESTGLSEEWIEAANQNIIIPMRGQLDSMNVSVSAAILLYEAVRQRTS